MSSEVAAHPASAFLGNPTTTAANVGEDTPEEIADLQRIINMRNEIYTFKHPRFKPSSISRAAHAEPANISISSLVEPPASKRAKPLSATASPWVHNKSSATPAAKSQIDDVLLTKSEVLIKAETSLKRQRLEQEVKHQLEQRKHETRMGMDVKDGHAVVEPEVDLQAIMERAGLRTKPIERPEDPASVNKLKGFFGPKEPETMKQAVPDKQAVPEKQTAPEKQAVPEKPSSAGDERFDRAHSTGTAPEARVVHQPSCPLPPPPRVVEAHRERERRPLAQAFRRDNVPVPPPAPVSVEPPPQQPERVPSPQPKYSVSQVRSPAAPQPVRPANMARVESQDHIMEIETGSAGGYSGAQERASPSLSIAPPQVPSKRARASPVPYIKQEPIASPFPRDDYARRPPSPERLAFRPPSRGSVYANRPPPYHYPEAPGREYGYPPPLRPAYEPQYPYREDPYAPAYHPPSRVDYRGYPPVYPQPLPLSHSPYYPPPARPVYDEYVATRYASRPPPTVRQSSVRRSASPGTYQRPRRDSRSASPTRQAERRLSPEEPDGQVQRPAPGSPRRGRPTITAVHMGVRIDDDRVEIRSAPEHAPVEYPGYAPPPRAYYEGREPYYPPPPPPPPPAAPRYLDDPYAPRPESVMLRRDGEYARNYRERDYAAGRPAIPMPEMPYAPDYARAQSRAPMGPPPEEYPPRAGVDYYGRPEAGRASIRPDERGYLPPRQQSVRPEMAEFFGDRYRAPSVRPGELERERYSMAPPMPPPPPPPAGYSYGEAPYRRY